MSNQIWDTPILIDNVKIKNRIVLPPIGSNWATDEGFVTDKMIKFYRDVAEGGCGMIVVEGTAISPEGKSASNTICLYDERHLISLSSLEKVIRKNNCFSSLQLYHSGAQANPNFTGYAPVSPSKTKGNTLGTAFASRELKFEEIKEIQDKFINSAMLASYAGFKSIEIHLAHGNLLHQFLSEHTNKRKDIYGGNLENRSRLILDIISGIKEKIPEIIVGVRTSGEDYLKDGINKKVNEKLLPMLEKRGVKYFSITAGIYETSKLKHEAMKKGEFFDYARGIKNMVKNPVIGVGKILDLDSAEKHLKAGDCDMVAIGRGLIADPFMIKKTRSNQPINKCIECNECAYLRFGKPNLSCPTGGY